MKNIKIEDGTATISINPTLYPLEVIYSASYIFLDKAYILLDGDSKKEIIIRLKPKKEAKDNHELEKLGGEFLNELINYADYRERAKETKNIREALLQRALFTNDPELIQNNTIASEDDAEFEKLLKEIEEKGDDALDDPQGIAIPWEEKYGKKKEEINEDENKKKSKAK